MIPFTVNPEFWKEDSQYLSRKLEIESYGLSTGLRLNNYNFKKENKVQVTIKNESLLIREKLKLNKVADTTLFLNENSWKKRGVLFDQLSMFSSLLQQIATCGTISKEDFQEITGIEIEKTLGKKIKNLPSFPIFRALNEAKKIRDKIVNINCVIIQE